MESVNKVVSFAIVWVVKNQRYEDLKTIKFQGMTDMRSSNGELIWHLKIGWNEISEAFSRPIMTNQWRGKPIV